MQVHGFVLKMAAKSVEVFGVNPAGRNLIAKCDSQLLIYLN